MEPAISRSGRRMRSRRYRGHIVLVSLSFVLELMSSISRWRSTMKSEIAWRADENGMLLGARVHDSHLVKLAVSEQSLEFDMCRLSGEIVTVELLGVGEFTLRELWNGAIVSEFWVWKVGSVPEVSWSIPDAAWNVLFSSRLKPADAKSAAAKIVQARPDSFLVQLACSYGGTMAAVCDRIA